MSQSFEYFFNYGGPFAQLADEVGAELGLALFDTVSATFVRLPEHWKTVSSRIPGRAFTAEAELSIDSYLRSTGHLVQDVT